LHSSTCINSCPSNYDAYNASEPNVCYQCSANCERCTAASDESCSSCLTGFKHYLGNQCVDPCPDGYYDNSGTCELCHISCETCSGGNQLTNCLSCNETRKYFTSNNTCLDECPSFFSTYVDNNICDACDPSCLSCTGSLINECSSCP
jgi:proprotein convertase subtilisin/kexin type 5